jgi:transposase
MIWYPKKLSREQMAERRRAGFELLKRKRLSQRAIAEKLGLSEAAVSQWHKVLSKEGMKGAKAKRASGRPAKLGQEQQQQLLVILRQGAKQAGFVSERWTQARVLKVLEKTFGVCYHFRSIGRLLKGLGWSLQQPRVQAHERNEDLIRAWLKQDWPGIKKSTTTRRRHRIY